MHTRHPLKRASYRGNLIESLQVVPLYPRLLRRIQYRTPTMSAQVQVVNWIHQDVNLLYTTRTLASRGPGPLRFCRSLEGMSRPCSPPKRGRVRVLVI